ncbi:hypothetical protein B0H63DRAFT_516785 [Podospora didyma]|uniref:Alternative oxidase n=1 Tax=Podospora didyma TaxID=330526 RepID=A0AAE0P5E4_9PEZI|nr:hypothetical protein B0H63DRAFT_516785 [Podospora didyma]
MLASPSVFKLLKFAGPLLLAVWSLSYFFSYEAAYHGVVRTFKDEEKLFIADFLEHEIDGKLDGIGISELCASKRWTPGLMLSCEPVPGGISQVKNAHLNCIRFAMEMGAALITPRIVKRHEKDITIIAPPVGGGPQRGEPLDYLFDFDHMNQTLSKYCPQMKIYKSLDDLYDVPAVHKAHPISLQAVGAHLINGSVIESTSILGEQIKNFTEKAVPKEKWTTPIRFHLPITNWAFRTANETESFAQSFGRILRPREDARRLSAAVLFSLHKEFGLNLDPRKGVKADSYVGIHLRTEPDAGNLFPTYENQAAYLLDYATISKVPVAFVATGASEQNITSFAARAKDFNVTVVLKKNLLRDQELDLFNTLTFDQRALVDYEIMLRAGLVAGPSESSFAWNLALRRKGISKAPTALNTTAVYPNSHVHYHDSLSTIFGRSEKGMVFKETIWP